MKQLRFLKEYQQFREDFEFNDSEAPIAPEMTENPNPEGLDSPEGEEEQTEASCQDILGDAIDNLSSAIQGCMGTEEVEETEEEEQFEGLEGEEDAEETEETDEAPEAGHDEREMEIYGRMKEIADELQGLMSELRGEEASEEGGEAEEGGEDFGAEGTEGEEEEEEQM